MDFDWSNYLRIAKDIETSGNKDEALLRTAVSRAYYSAINLAAKNAQEKHKHPPFSSKNFHSDVISFYTSDMNNPNYYLAGKLLRTLHTSRGKCDYDASFTGDLEKLLGSSIIQAENIKSELAKKTY